MQVDSYDGDDEKRSSSNCTPGVGYATCGVGGVYDASRLLTLQQTVCSRCEMESL